MKIALTGGVGSGKSTVATLLAEHGAVVIDADAIAREAVEPGTPGLGAIVMRFGPGVLRDDGTLDRAGLASIVFADASARADLNEIIHPLVAERSAELMDAAAPGAIVVYDVPLLAEGGRRDEFDRVVVVEASEPTRLDRLADRGLPEAEAKARMSAQASDAQRRAIADDVIDNDGDLDALRAAVDALWARLHACA